MQTESLATPAAATDTFPINGTDYIEFWVGNARQASHYYRTAFGFQLVGYRGPETGVRDRASYLLQQDKIRFVLTTPIRGVKIEPADLARIFCGGEIQLGSIPPGQYILEVTVSDQIAQTTASQQTRILVE